MALVNVQLEVDGPITQMDEADLVRTEGVYDDENEFTKWTEYRLKADPNAERAVHRSVDLVLKKAAVFADGVAAQLT